MNVLIKVSRHPRAHMIGIMDFRLALRRLATSRAAWVSRLRRLIRRNVEGYLIQQLLEMFT